MSTSNITMPQLLSFMAAQKGSDLHVGGDAVPRMRLHGELKPLSLPALTQEEATRIIYGILTPEQIKKFEESKELDCSYEIPNVSRYRVNVAVQRGRIRTTIRTIPTDIKTFEDLGMNTPVFEKICKVPKGLILVTGATGSGKSTTLSAMIDYVNRHRPSHIVTIEDPIEFVHPDKMCMVTQREVGADTYTFAAALKHVLRQDPDIVLIGEMRDQETVQVGLELSETGHLTFATLHTSDCIQTITRIIDIFSPEQQNQVRTQLGFVLESVVCQQLLKTKDGKGRAVAQEIMIANQSIRANIRSDKIHQIYSTIQTGAQAGMTTMNQSLARLVVQGKVDVETALKSSSKVEELETQLREDGIEVPPTAALPDQNGGPEGGRSAAGAAAARGPAAGGGATRGPAAGGAAGRAAGGGAKKW